MKRISTILLTLVLTVSMLAPEFSMLPAVYAQDETPALEQNVDSAGDAEAAAGAVDTDAGSADTAAEAAGGATAGQTVDSAGDTESAAGAVDTDANRADTAAEPDSGDRASGDSTATVPEAGQDPSAAPAAKAVGDAFGDSAVPADSEEAKEGEEPASAADFDLNSYDRLSMTDLYDAGALVIPESMQDKITFSRTGSGLLINGKIEDLNSTYLTLKNELDFDSGSVGRLSIDGLRDKDRGMTVEVEVYLDGSKSPQVKIPLKKQMGKEEWSNKGEQSVNLSEAGLTGKHHVDLMLKVSGKDVTKKTTVLLRSIRFCRTTVPVMYFDIDESEGTIEAMNTSEDHSAECYGTVDLIVPDEFNSNEAFRDEYKSQNSIKGIGMEYIRGRGNSTWMEEKKPYKIKFEKAQDLFGFGKNKHWVLLANRYDNSLIRNRMTYWLGRELGMEYTPECVPVEVVMNGEYYGSYLLCEQIRVGTGRVEIDDLDDEDIPYPTEQLIETGGYLLSMSWAGDDTNFFTTKNGMNLYIESPEDNVAYFNEYIKAYVQKVENAIFSPDFKGSDGKPYTDYLDLDAAVDYWWIQEFSENGDAYGSGSTYLYKKREKQDDPKSGKLYWGPLWDFDFVAWGDLDYSSTPEETLDYTSTPWFTEMKSDPMFVKAVKDRWLEEGGLKEKMQEIVKEGGLLDKYKKQMATSYDYDHEVWGPYESELKEYSGEIEQLRTWINCRIEYVDGEISSMSTDPHTVKFMADGKLISTVKVIGALRESDIPKAPNKKGYVFIAWTDKDGLGYGGGDRVYEDLVLNAAYTDVSEIVQAKDIFFRRYDVYYFVFPEENGRIMEWFFPEYKVMPEEAYDSKITWTCSNEKIAEMDPEDGSVMLKGLGDATITAKLDNGVTRSYRLHVVPYTEIQEWESSVLSKRSLKMKEGEYTQLLTKPTPVKCEEPEFAWISTNEDVAIVDNIGVVTAVAPGTAEILAINFMTHEILKCKVTVRPQTTKGMVVKRGGSMYKITSDKKGNRRAMLIKARNAGWVTIPASIKLYGKKYSVTKIKAKAFAKSRTTRIFIKTKKLSKARVKGALKGSKVKRIYLRVGKAKTNRSYAKKYKKFFTKKNAGKTVVVK